MKNSEDLKNEHGKFTSLPTGRQASSVFGLPTFKKHDSIIL